MAIAEEHVFEVCPAMEAILHGVQGRILEQAAETEGRQRTSKFDESSRPFGRFWMALSASTRY